MNKTLIFLVGFCVGISLTVLFIVDSTKVDGTKADSTNQTFVAEPYFGLVVPEGSNALIADKGGYLYIVNGSTGKAERVKHGIGIAGFFVVR